MKKNKFLFILTAALVSACYKMQPCVEYQKRFFSKELSIVVIDKGPQGNSFHIKGTQPGKLAKVGYADVDGLYNFIWNNLEIGDTIIKNAGDDKFLLRKKGFNILIEYDCEDSIDGTVKQDTLKK